MKRHFDDELKQLQKGLSGLAGLVRQAIFNSIESLRNCDAGQAKEVIAADRIIDELELSIDDKCIDLIARYQPMACDLRFITTGMKINAELERIADLAVDICERVLELVDKPLLKPLVDIPKLAEIAKDMVANSVDSFVRRDAELAKKVVLSDSEADGLRNSIQQELIEQYMARDASTVGSAIPLLLIARHLERICDHTTNIAEDVIYMIDARVVKHHIEKLQDSE